MVQGQLHKQTSQWYEDRDTYREGAIECYNAHGNPTLEGGGCLDYLDDSKMIGKAEYHDEGRTITIPKKLRQYLCYQCPYQQSYINVEIRRKGWRLQVTVTYDWATDTTTVVTNLATELVYPVGTSFVGDHDDALCTREGVGRHQGAGRCPGDCTTRSVPSTAQRHQPPARHELPRHGVEQHRPDVHALLLRGRGDVGVVPDASR